MIISLIVAAAENDAIGRNNSLIWHIPEDLARFREITMGHHVVLGRKTFESLAGPLEGRTLIVLTRKMGTKTDRTLGKRDPMQPLVAHSPEEAIRLARERGERELFVAGGGEIYRLFWNPAHRIYLTRVHSTIDGDTFFPSLGSEWIEERREDRRSADPYPISFVLYSKQQDSKTS